MKIAFSTLACPNSIWRDIYSMAKDIGFDGIEVRGLGSDILAMRARPFTEAELPATMKKLNTLRLSIPCFSSNCCLKFADKKEENKRELTEYIQLAQKTGTPYVRVLADLDVRPDGEVDDELVIAQLRELAPIAEAHGVPLLVETNGVYTDTARLRRLLSAQPATPWPPCGICTTPTASPARPRSRPCSILAPTSSTSMSRIPSWWGRSSSTA